MKENSIVFSEVLFIISQLPASYKAKIPNNLLQKMYDDCSKEYYKNFISDKPFFKQNLSEESLLLFNDIAEHYL